MSCNGRIAGNKPREQVRQEKRDKKIPDDGEYVIRDSKVSSPSHIMKPRARVRLLKSSIKLCHGHLRLFAWCFRLLGGRKTTTVVGLPSS